MFKQKDVTTMVIVKQGKDETGILTAQMFSNM